MKLSVVTTLYMSEAYIEEFYRRTTNAARAFASDDYEIVMINDGSPDDSLKIALKLVEQDSHLRIVDLSRNFGHHKAMFTGLRYASGDFIFLVDSDLEEEPEWLISFGEHMFARNCDLVYGVQKKRKGGFFEKWSGVLFYKIINALCEIEHPKDITTARLMSRKYVNALLLHKERNVVLSLLCVITGFEQSTQEVVKHSSSTTTYSLSKKITSAITSLTSFSDYPLRVIFFSGVILSACSFAYALYLICRRVFSDSVLDGWSSIMASIWIFGSLIILFIGIVGIYVANIFAETKQRPLTIVREVYDGSKCKYR